MPSTSDNALQGIFCKLEERLNRARRLHPEFSFGPYQALGVVEAEVGEFAREVIKGKPGWRGRAEDELYDVMVTAIRFLLGEYVQEEG